MHLLLHPISRERKKKKPQKKTKTQKQQKCKKNAKKNENAYFLERRRIFSWTKTQKTKTKTHILGERCQLGSDEYCTYFCASIIIHHKLNTSFRFQLRQLFTWFLWNEVLEITMTRFLSNFRQIQIHWYLPWLHKRTLGFPKTRIFFARCSWNICKLLTILNICKHLKFCLSFDLNFLVNMKYLIVYLIGRFLCDL